MPSTQVQVLPGTAGEDGVQSEGVDSDHFSGSNSSFLANEKLMSVDSMNSDITGTTSSVCPQELLTLCSLFTSPVLVLILR